VSPAARSSVAIAADDLTGAADTVAVFAQHGWRSRLVLDANRLRSAERSVAQALDTCSRAGSLEALGTDAIAAVDRHLSGAELAFLKIDSLLRGRWPADVRAVTAAGAWDRVILAPAFPERGRSFIDGRVRVDGGAIAHELPLASLDSEGLAPVHVGLSALRADPDALSRNGVLVVDAETDEDLQRVAARATERRTLWIGSAGLARALAETPVHGPVDLPVLQREGPIVTLVGSRTELARRQVEKALRHDGSLRHVELDLPQLDAESLALPEGENVLISIARGGSARYLTGEGDETLVRNLARLVSGHDDGIGALVIVGGQTARAALLALGLDELEVLGELEPGIALCIDARGRPVITKSGSFGDDSALRRIHESLAA
jgi:uncharacterized protein YgbK (DUF1537 family)